MYQLCRTLFIIALWASSQQFFHLCIFNCQMSQRKPFLDPPFFFFFFPFKQQCKYMQCLKVKMRHLFREFTIPQPKSANLWDLSVQTAFGNGNVRQESAPLALWERMGAVSLLVCSTNLWPQPRIKHWLLPLCMGTCWRADDTGRSPQSPRAARVGLGPMKTDQVPVTCLSSLLNSCTETFPLEGSGSPFGQGPQRKAVISRLDWDETKTLGSKKRLRGLPESWVCMETHTHQITISYLSIIIHKLTACKVYCNQVAQEDGEKKRSKKKITKIILLDANKLTITMTH